MDLILVQPTTINVFVHLLTHAHHYKVTVIERDEKFNSWHLNRGWGGNPWMGTSGRSQLRGNLRDFAEISSRFLLCPWDREWGEISPMVQRHKKMEITSILSEIKKCHLHPHRLPLRLISRNVVQSSANLIFYSLYRHCFFIKWRLTAAEKPKMTCLWRGTYG